MVESIVTIISFFLMLFGFFQVFKINIFEMSNESLNYLLDEEKVKNMNINKRVKILKGKKKENIIVKEVKKAKNILEVTDQLKNLPIVFSSACGLSFLAVIICIIINNFFLIIPLAFGFFLIPFWFMQSKINAYKKTFNAELETALSIITTSYLRTENIIISVQENIQFINKPIKTYFEEFLIDTAVNPNVELALKKLKNKIDNNIFKEWIENLIFCESNRDLKSVLEAIVSKFSSLKIVNDELDTLFALPKKNFFTMCSLLISSAPLMGLVNSDLFNNLFYSLIGKVALSIAVGILFYAINQAVNICKPLEE